MSEASYLSAVDVNGNEYEVTPDHTQARRVGDEEFRDLPEIRMEVGRLYLRSGGVED